MKIGLVGCGRIAADHLLIYRCLGNASVVAVSDIDLERAKSFASQNGIGKVCNGHTDLFRDKDLDFVDVCTPPSTHADIVCDAAEAGQNVLLEKPMALSTGECERMIREVKKHGTSLCVCHNQIFFPAISEAKRLVDSGDLSIVSFRTSVRENPNLYAVPAWNTSPKERGLIWEVGCHPAYLQLHLLGNVTEVYAVGRKVRYPVYDEFSVLMKTSGQAYGIVEVSWLANETEKIYELNCSNGKRAFMISPPPTANLGYETLVQRPGVTDSRLGPAVRNVLSHFRRKQNRYGYFVGHFYLIRGFIDSLMKGGLAPVLPEDGLRVVRLLECIERSMDLGEAVSVR